MSERRRATLYMDIRELATMRIGDTVISTDVPGGARVTEWRFVMGGFVITLESPSFDVVPDGKPLPEIDGPVLAAVPGAEALPELPRTKESAAEPAPGDVSNSTHTKDCTCDKCLHGSDCGCIDCRAITALIDRLARSVVSEET